MTSGAVFAAAASDHSLLPTRFRTRTRTWWRRPGCRPVSKASVAEAGTALRSQPFGLSSRRCCTNCSVSGGDAAGAPQETRSEQVDSPHSPASADTPEIFGGFSKTFSTVTAASAIPDSGRTSVPRVTCDTRSMTVSSSSRRRSSASADSFSVRVPVRVALPAGMVTLFVPARV